MNDQAHDHIAETHLLAACLVSKTARDEARKHITGRDLYDQRHEFIWDAMSRLDRHGKPVDAVTLLATLGAGSPAGRLMPELVTTIASPDSIDAHAAIVRGWAVKRRLHSEAMRVLSEALNPNAQAAGMAAAVATRFAAIRDTGISDDVESITLTELLAEEDDEPDWLVRGLLERGDRLILTGEEGLGKSYLLRQMAVMAAHGLHPFEVDRIPPINAAIIDCENSRGQVRRKVRGVAGFAARYGCPNPNEVNLLTSSRMDITRDKDLARIHRELDATQPDLLVIGPLYRLVPRALQTDDEAAPVLAALDTLKDRGIALLIEAHAGHAIGKGGSRDLRPRGSSALMGWPEFGFGMRSVASGYADLVPWRGQRDERAWPDRVRHDNHRIRWIPVEAVDVEGVA